MTEPVLAIRGLRTSFATPRGPAWAVDGIDLDVHAGRTTCLVGESGCGKSVTALSILGLVRPPGAIDGRSVIALDDHNLVTAGADRLRRVRGGEISMVFQEPMSSFTPVYTIGAQISEMVRRHRQLSRHAARDVAIEMLAKVGFPDPQRRVDAYPHELSGGMRQRVMIAMALSCGPRLLIADEPTTALDVTVQAQILELLMGLQAELRMAILLITHDFGVVAEVADEVAVMYAGRIVERGTAGELLAAPRIPTPPPCWTRSRCSERRRHSGLRDDPRRGRRSPTACRRGAASRPAASWRRRGASPRTRCCRRVGRSEWRAGSPQMTGSARAHEHGAAGRGDGTRDRVRVALVPRVPADSRRRRRRSLDRRRRDARARRGVGLREEHPGADADQVARAERGAARVRRRGHHACLAPSLRGLRRDAQIIFQDPGSALSRADDGGRARRRGAEGQRRRHAGRAARSGPGHARERRIAARRRRSATRTSSQGASGSGSRSLVRSSCVRD